MKRRRPIATLFRAAYDAAAHPTPELDAEVDAAAASVLPAMLLCAAAVTLVVAVLSLLVWIDPATEWIIWLRFISALCFGFAALYLQHQPRPRGVITALALFTGLLLIANGLATLTDTAESRASYELALVIVLLGVLPISLPWFGVLLVVALVSAAGIIMPGATPEVRNLVLLQLSEAVGAAVVFAAVRHRLLRSFVEIKRGDRERERRLTLALAAAQEQRDQTRQRETSLDVVGFAAAQFLEAERYEDAVGPLLERLALALGASYTALACNVPTSSGELGYIPLFECDGTTALPARSPHTRSYVALGMQRIMALLSRGELISGTRASLPTSDHPVFDHFGLQALLVAPVMVDGRWWGWIGADDQQVEREWSVADQTVMRTVAGIVGAAIRRDRDHISAVRAEAVSRFLADATAALSGSLDTDIVLKTITDLCVPALADFCSIHTSDGSDAHMREVAHSVIRPELAAMVRALAEYPIGPTEEAGFVRVFASGISELVPVIDDAWFHAIAQDAEHLALLRQADLRSALTVPLRSGGRIYGTISFRRSGPETVPFDAETLRLAEELAARAAIAVENARLYRKAQRRLDEFSTVQRLAQAINSRLDLTAVFETTVTQISRTFGYKMVSIYLLQENRLVLQYYVGYENVYRTIDVTLGATGRSIRGRRPVFVRDARQDPDFIYAVGGITQGIFVPLVSGAQQILGMLMVESRADPVLTEDDFSLLQIVADQVSLAVVNAQLLADARHELAERQRAEQARLQLERKMLDAQKLESLGVLVGGIAHDFNNLLTVVQGNAHLARSDVPPDSFAAESIGQIELATRHATELVKQMLVYAGKGRFLKEPLDLNALIDQIASLLHVTIPRTIRLIYELVDRPPQIEADPSQIRQVVMNLVINAAEASGTAEGTVRLRTELCWLDRADMVNNVAGDLLPAGQYVRLTVSDTGVGMDPATLARIFDPFFSTKFAGRGLGLAAVLGIIRSHGGGLYVQSEVGRGTEFQVILPYIDQAPAVPLPEVPAAIWRGAGLALVVDDEAAIRLFASRALERLGFEALTADDGQSGVAIVQQRHAELRCVLLDLTMPRMGGAEAFETIRAIAPQLPILVMSGYDTDDALRRFSVPPIFLQKPFTVDALRDTLRDVLAVA